MSSGYINKPSLLLNNKCSTFTLKCLQHIGFGFVVMLMCAASSLRQNISSLPHAELLLLPLQRLAASYQNDFTVGYSCSPSPETQQSGTSSLMTTCMLEMCCRQTVNSLRDTGQTGYTDRGQRTYRVAPGEKFDIQLVVWCLTPCQLSAFHVSVWMISRRDTAMHQSVR